MSGDTVSTAHDQTYAPARAARELTLRRREFDLAVRLGHLRTVLDEGGGGRRVTHAELDRLRAQTGFPDLLRARVETVGTREGAELLGVSPGRFTRLARLGVLVPVTFYLNRYRAVVWRYLAEELRQVAATDDNKPLLTGRTPSGLREQLEEGLDLRARNWRGRHLGFLLREADGHPWARAAALASLLDPAQVAEIVPDPYERAQLGRFLPRAAPHGSPGSPTAHLAERIATAVEPDEIDWLRADLAQTVAEARAQEPASRPTPSTTAPAARLGEDGGTAFGTLPPPPPPPVAVPRAGVTHRPRPRRPRGLLGRLRRAVRHPVPHREAEYGA
ncbi:DUF6397 family protein [Streptomyces sp. DSM 41014]|uniref:DUF6397 family protein n=1 Tax=Streptomyces hintoniae TaxID=3075521 RepID=A0ABU2UK01_9ACTN|nr:DUF6397 family protein [Streptomyces sp. DSM 41014]MDT0473202.1 DUF6397 family protein [Streptomyces sp. DSM 41014]